MTRFEYRVVTWEEASDEAKLQAFLNEAGAEGWEAVGMVARGASTPMPGMGSSKNAPDIVVLLKRALSEG